MSKESGGFLNKVFSACEGVVDHIAQARDYVTGDIIHSDSAYLYAETDCEIISFDPHVSKPNSAMQRQP